jgi:peptide/nickel transport system permease protein
MKQKIGYLLYSLSILWGVVSLCFFLFYVFPDAEEQLLGQRSDAQTREALRSELGLDKSLAERYTNYLAALSPITISQKQNPAQKGFSIPVLKGFFIHLKAPQLGKSYQNKKAVATMLKEALAGTMVLAITAMFFAFVGGIILGIIAGLNYGKWLDNTILAGSTLFISIPSFFSAMIIAWLFGYVWHSYTGLPMSGSLYAIELSTGNRVLALSNLVLPSIALAVRPIAVITQLMRGAILKEMESDYIRTAKAKGLHSYAIIWKHALINALNPVLTAASGWFASLMAGAFFVEYIFNWKGLGKTMIEAVQMADLPVVSGAVLYVAVIFILVNMAVNFSYRFLDPKLKSNA